MLDKITLHYKVEKLRVNPIVENEIKAYLTVDK